MCEKEYESRWKWLNVDGKNVVHSSGVHSNFQHFCTVFLVLLKCKKYYIFYLIDQSLWHTGILHTVKNPNEGTGFIPATFDHFQRISFTCSHMSLQRFVVVLAVIWWFTSSVLGHMIRLPHAYIHPFHPFLSPAHNDEKNWSLWDKPIQWTCLIWRC